METTITKVSVTDVSFDARDDTGDNQDLADALRKKEIGEIYNIDHFKGEDPLCELADAVSDRSGWCVFWVRGEILP